MLIPLCTYCRAPLLAERYHCPARCDHRPWRHRHAPCVSGSPLTAAQASADALIAADSAAVDPLIERIGYELSGLPAWGFVGDRVYSRSYVLYDGYRPHAERGVWLYRGTLDAADRAALGALTELERDQFAAGYLEHRFLPPPRYSVGFPPSAPISADEARSLLRDWVDRDHAATT